jgi:NAD(P)-dependent dehydrogenase (short-subunit alcohol dehydrogenase family)
MLLRTGDVVLVSGGRSGLGAAVVQRFAAAGTTVVVLDLPRADDAAAPAPGVQHVDGDVRSEADVAAAVEFAASLGSLRVAVTCAGIAPASRVVGRDGPHPLALYEDVVGVNLVGTFNVARLAAVAMSEQEPTDGERGVLVMTASIAAFDGQVGQVAYAASKGGVAAMTLPLARDLAGRLVRVVTVAPGIFDTAMLGGLPQPVRDGLAALVPHPARLGDPAEFAALVGHIVANPMLNGEVVRLDGALRMPPR